MHQTETIASNSSLWTLFKITSLLFLSSTVCIPAWKYRHERFSATGVRKPAFQFNAGLWVRREECWTAILFAISCSRCLIYGAQLRKESRQIQVKWADCGVYFLFKLTTWNLVYEVFFSTSILHTFFKMRTLDTGMHRKQVSMGENEKKFIVECYNLCRQGKEWKEVLTLGKKGDKGWFTGAPDGYLCT